MVGARARCWSERMNPRAAAQLPETSPRIGVRYMKITRATRTEWPLPGIPFLLAWERCVGVVYMASEGLPSPRVQPEEDVGEESPIRVIVRVRPVPAAAARTAALTVRPPNEIHVQRAQGDLQAGFDAVLGPDAEQAFVYDHVGPAVDAAIQGLNSTVFAYGQTGSGKTHTLFGGLLPDDNAAANAGGGAEFLEGMAARALRQLFAQTEASRRRAPDSPSVAPSWRFTTSISPTCCCQRRRGAAAASSWR